MRNKQLDAPALCRDDRRPSLMKVTAWLVLLWLGWISLPALSGQSPAAQETPVAADATGEDVTHSQAEPEHDASEEAGGHGEQHAAEHDEEHNGHADPIAPVLIGIVLIILVARVAGHFFELFGQPAVLGELVVGVILGNLYLVGIDTFEFLKVDFSVHNPIYLDDPQHLAGVTIEHLSRIGVIILLFQVGLETSVAEMRSVGLSALAVALIGVILPTGLGWGCGMVMLPESHWAVHMFIGATLCATSVGITARVLQDLKRSKSKEAQIILGAAVIDDVLGLVVLAVAQGIIGALNLEAAGGSVEFGYMELLLIVGKALGFLVAALIIGQFLSRPLFRLASSLQGSGLLVVTALAVCFIFSWAANMAGLATIVGAFAAGLILEEVHYRELREREGAHSLEELIHPLASLLVPIFFVEMGLKVDLTSFADPKVLMLAGALIVAAVIGKQACSLGVLEKGVNRLAIGLGMIPRGEVGLIFAAIGLQLELHGLKIVDRATYSGLVVMVIVTTMVTPPLLKWSLSRSENSETPQVT